MIEKEHDPFSEKITFLGRTAVTAQILFASRWSKQDPMQLERDFSRENHSPVELVLILIQCQRG